MKELKTKHKLIGISEQAFYPHGIIMLEGQEHWISNTGNIYNTATGKRYLPKESK